MLLALAGLAACSPTFNWREVRPEGTQLLLLLPCKPDHAEKTVPLGGQPAPLSMLGCDTGDATFAVTVVTLPDAARAGVALAQWQAATLANMKAAPLGSTDVRPFKLAGAAGQPVLVRAIGKRPDGSAVSGTAAYFAQGAQIFQVVAYAEKPAPEVLETFFSSLKFE